MGRSHRLNVCIKSVSNRFSVPFNRNTFPSLVIPWNIMLMFYSPSNSMFDQVIDLADLLVFCNAGVFNVFHICKFKIDRSVSESNCSFLVVCHWEIHLKFYLFFCWVLSTFRDAHCFLEKFVPCCWSRSVTSFPLVLSCMFNLNTGP